MAQFLYKLGHWSYRKKFTVIICWLLLLGGIGGASAALQKGFNDVFQIPGMPSEQASYMVNQNFPDQKNPLLVAGVTMVFAAPEGHTLDEPVYSEAIQDVVTTLENTVPGLIKGRQFGNPLVVDPQIRELIIEQETAYGLPLATAEADADNVSLVSKDRRIAYTSFELDVPYSSAVTDEHRAAINEAMEVGRAAGLQVEGGGSGFGDPIVIKSTSEIIGLGVAFVVLVFTFGSLVAAGLPLITAVVGIGIGSLSIMLATAFLDLNNVTPVLAVMLGLAVGIDYSLFILSRYRTEYRKYPREVAAGIAVGTAGSAVVFAGLTVIVALAALALVGIPFLTWMGAAAALTVAVAVAVALTLLPALMGLCGSYTFGVKIPGIAGNPRPKNADKNETDAQAQAREDARVKKGQRWARTVHRFPGLVLTLVILGLGALSVPALGLEMSLPSDSTSYKNTTQRKSADLLAEGFGPGVNAPFLVVVDAHNVNTQAKSLSPIVDGAIDDAISKGQPLTQTEIKQVAAGAAYARVLQLLGTSPDVKHMQLFDASDDGLAAQMLLTPVTGPADADTPKILGALRNAEKEIEDTTGIVIGITGLTPIQAEITESLGAAMPRYLAVVVGLAILLLLIVFRSVMVPLVAGLGFLLSVGAAFGLTVLFWQKGLWGIVGTPAPIISFMPIFLIGVTFGLAMDYQVFLVSRMREHYASLTAKKDRAPGRYNAVEESVIEGFSMGSRVVTAAALIMISVFVAFIDQPLPFIKIFGFALAAGVLCDAFFVRMGLVPASMFLMGRATWWIPRWLDNILPHIDIEGEALARQIDRQRRDKEARADVELEASRARGSLKKSLKIGGRHSLND
ncbi:MMPL family transporter [Corynebacterium mendelii]|uniref:MMPL family transporter n=1 Tax=Corynebacterium mendelii TaxID=2765362 RepID=A0A939E1B9_9CORY|nr:MMPL family transporter [Corynebacterium mendelii]MBN9643722.1 MMPL family transporter [Corynebacterium mendelii]